MKDYFQISIDKIVHYLNVIGTMSNKIVGILLDKLPVTFK